MAVDTKTGIRVWDLSIRDVVNPRKVGGNSRDRRRSRRLGKRLAATSPMVACYFATGLPSDAALLCSVPRAKALALLGMRSGRKIPKTLKQNNFLSREFDDLIGG